MISVKMHSQKRGYQFALWVIDKFSIVLVDDFVVNYTQYGGVLNDTESFSQANSLVLLTDCAHIKSSNVYLLACASVPCFSLLSVPTLLDWELKHHKYQLKHFHDHKHR